MDIRQILIRGKGILSIALINADFPTFAEPCNNRALFMSEIAILAERQKHNSHSPKLYCQNS